MDNEISKAIKRKTDAQMRMNATDITPVVNEGVGNTTIINDPSKYIIPMVAGQNVTIGTSGSNKVINALMNILAGGNITVTEPDENGAVTISANIGGKPIDLTGLADGYVLTYDATTDSFKLAELPDTLSQATETELGGVKAKARTTENAEVAIDETNGKLYAPAGGGLAEIPQATETTLGGVKAKEKTTETSEVAIDPITGKLYAPESEGSYTLPQASEATLGGVMAKVKTDETTEVSIDPLTGKLYVPEIGSSLPVGGPTGYFLKKNSNTDGDISWASPPIKLVSPGGVILEDFEGDTFRLPTTHSANVVRTTGGRSGMCMYRPYMNSQNDNLTITLESVFGGKVSFYYKTRMQLNNYSYNTFRVTDNGVTKLSEINTKSSWTYVEFDIAPGHHEFKFYESSNDWKLEFWIDDITFPANGVEGMDGVHSNPDSLLVVDSSGLTVGFIPKTAFITAPETEGAAGQILMTDGAGGRSWGDIVHPAPMVSTGTELPTADISYRGQIFTVLGDVGVADVAYVCLKDAADAYAWVEI